jgi:hypothetical protein
MLSSVSDEVEENEETEFDLEARMATVAAEDLVVVA